MKMNHYSGALVNSIETKLKINWKPDLIINVVGPKSYFDKGVPTIVCHKTADY